MALSNIATPKYYGAFRDAVLRGEIPVCQEIAQEMHRVDLLIEDPTIYYDDNAVEGWIAYCENELTLTDGSDLRLLDTFKLWGEQLFGWWYFEEKNVYCPDERGGHIERHLVKKRLITKQYLIVTRGAAKSMYAMTIQSFFLNVDTSTTDQITTAPTMKQAEEIMSPFRTAITRARGPLFQFLTEGSLQNTTGSRALRQKLVSTKKGIENTLTGSLLEVRPMSVDALQGSRAKIWTIDEWLSGDTRENVIECANQGASKNKDYLILATSSEGTVRNGIGDTIKMHLRKVLRGEIREKRTSIWYYKLDSIDEINNPAMWIKAQPNIGLTVSYETYMEDKETAEHDPSVRNDILAKRFGLEVEGFTYFFTYEETEPTVESAEFYGMPCALGADLSQGDDFCAFTFLFPLQNGTFGVKTRCYITDNTYLHLQEAQRIKYDEFEQEGTLIRMPGITLDLSQVYEDLEAHIGFKEYDVRCFGYDPYNAKEFVARWETENGPFGIEKVIQGARTESVPLGEIKKLTENRMLIFDEKALMWTMGNSIVIVDTNGNRKLQKRRNEQKIDAVAALMDAYVAYKANTDAFI